jgi:hypothetical protein
MYDEQHPRTMVNSHHETQVDLGYPRQKALETMPKMSTLSLPDE